MNSNAGMQAGYRKNKMAAQKKKWVIADRNNNAGKFADSLKVSELTAQVLMNRGVDEVGEGLSFLQPKLMNLISPELMPGVRKALEIIKAAVKNGKQITIYGDYDVDGITSVSMLWQLFTLLKAKVDYYIPHRVDEGYGLNADAVTSLAQGGTELLITVDCGVCAVEAVALAKSLGMEVIVTDHHRPGEKLPEADAIVHPSLDDSYGNPDSAGAMVAFKLAWAVANAFSAGEKLDGPLREFMLNATSLAAMGTVADVVDLRGENRVLVSYGLKSLPNCGLCGVSALIEAAGLTGQGLDSFHIGFRLAPMINAAGRMGHARLAVELLTCESLTRAMQIAQYLKEQNTLRQKCEKDIFKQACEQIREKGLSHPDRKTIVLAGENWHSGVIGIVASRIVDKFYRPTIMINIGGGDDEYAHGSARSIEGFDMLAAISSGAENLVRFGGHKMAAGITIEAEKIEKFAESVEEYASTNLDLSDICSKLKIDSTATLEQFRIEAVNELNMLEPFGQGNPKPLFATKGVRLCSNPRTVGANNSHLQLAVTDNTKSIRCIGFNFGRLEKKLLEKKSFNIAYYPHINNYNGNSNVEFIIEDIQFDDE